MTELSVCTGNSALVYFFFLSLRKRNRRRGAANSKLCNQKAGAKIYFRELCTFASVCIIVQTVP